MIETTVLSPQQMRTAPARRHPDVVIQAPSSGASPFGSTFWKSLFRCPREHAMMNLVGLQRTRHSEALDVGLLFHAALEEYYKVMWEFQKGFKSFDHNDTKFLWSHHKDALKNTFDTVVTPLLDEPGYEATHGVVERLVGGYFDHYYQQDKWRVVAVEETLLCDDVFSYSTRIDLIVEDYVRGGMWITEHKSARTITAELLEGYQMDIQILGQVWLLHQCVDLTKYPPFRGVIINIGTKHVTPQFERVEVCPSRYHLRMFEDSMNNWTRMRAVFQANGWPQALGNCIGPSRGFGRCDFFDLCHGQPEATVADWLEQDAPYGFARREEQTK